jgi:hypothetical protein
MLPDFFKSSRMSHLDCVKTRASKFTASEVKITWHDSFLLEVFVCVRNYTTYMYISLINFRICLPWHLKSIKVRQIDKFQNYPSPLTPKGSVYTLSIETLGRYQTYFHGMRKNKMSFISHFWRQSHRGENVLRSIRYRNRSFFSTIIE